MIIVKLKKAEFSTCHECRRRNTASQYTITFNIKRQIRLCGRCLTDLRGNIWASSDNEMYL